MSKILTRQQIEQYYDEGFISPVRVISEVEALSIKAELEEVEAIFQMKLMPRAVIIFTCLLRF